MGRLVTLSMASAVLAIGCGPDLFSHEPPPTLVVTPNTATVTAGGLPAYFTADLRNDYAWPSTQGTTVYWYLHPSTIGTVSVAPDGRSAAYIAPSEVAAETQVALEARAATQGLSLSSTASIRVLPVH
jgi:hypothetical protein